MHLKRNASKFEKDINLQYQQLISQNENSDKKVAATKLKGWNNGYYLDNILDTSLHLFKPKTEQTINQEKEFRYNVLYDLLYKKQEKNIKKTNAIINLSKQNNKEPFLLTERRQFFSSKDKDNMEENMKFKIKSVKNVINSYNNKKKTGKNKKIEIDSDTYDIENKIRKPNSFMNKKIEINNINLEMRKIAMKKKLRR